MKIAVFGSTGPTGLLVIDNALGEGHDVVAYARSPAKLGPLANKIKVVEGELGEGKAISAAIEGCNAVISLLGPGTDKNIGLPVTEGTAHILSAMTKQGVRRLVAISTPSSVDARDRFSPAFSFFIFMIKTLYKSAYQDIVASARLVRESDRDWTLVRVPMLNDKKPTGKLVVGYIGRDGVKTALSRGDLAGFLVAQLGDSRFVGQAPAISNA